MNLFDNILNQSKNKFLGTQPSVPSTPSFATPQAPRTVNYTAPQVQQKPSMTLFSDEQQMFQKMKADNLDDNTAYSMLKKRRMDILGGNDLGNDEKEMLLKMQADNVPVKQAVSMIQQRRKDQFNKKYEEGNLLQKGAYNTLAFAAGNLETVAKYGGNALDFITGGTMGFGDEVKKMEQVTQSPEFDSIAFKAGTYAPDVALAVSPIGGGYLAGAKGMTGLQGANLFSQAGAKNLTQGLIGRSAVVGAGFGGVQPILDKGSDATMEDIATGAAVGGAAGAIATPVISKALKYGQAGYRGGLTGMGKSISRDVKAGVNIITPSGANISTKANRFNASEIRNFIKTTGQSPGDFATSRGMTKVGDDAVVEATNLWQKSKDQADEALKAIKGRFRFTDEGEDLLKTTLDDLETRLVNTKSPDYKRISQLKAKYEDTGLTMSEINEVKRAYSNNYKYSFVDAGSESALRSKNLQDAVRKWQFKVAEENGLTNLKEINKTTQGWKMFADSLSKKIQGSSGNNNVSLTDWIALSGGSPENIALYLGKKLASSDTVKSGAIKLFSKKTKPSIIQASKADIQQANFEKNVNRGVSGVGDNSGGKSMVRPVGLLPAPSGKATGAKNFRVNQPAEKPPIKNEGQVGVRPGSKSQAQIKEEVQLAKQATRQSELKLITDDIASATERARYGGTGNTRIETQLNGKMDAGKLTREEAIDIATEILQDVQKKGISSKYKYIDSPKLEEYINDLYSNKKMPTFDDLLNESKVSEPVVPKKTVNAPIVKKSGVESKVETNKDIFDEDTRKVLFEYQPKGYNVPKNADIYPSESGIGVSYKGKGRVDFYISTKDGKIKVSTDNLGGNATDFIQDAWKRVGKDMESKLTPQSNAKQQGIKPKSSDTIPEGYIENAFGEIQKNPSNKKVSPKAPIDKPMIQLLDEKTPGYIKNSLELAQSPTTMGRYISEILGKDIKNVSVKDISEFYKKYGPFPKWEKRLQDGVTGYEKGRMPGMSENGYKQDKLLLKAFYQSKSLTPQSNAKQQGIKPKSTTTNVFGETIDKPSNKKGGFIRNPFAKIEPKRLFAGENSAQPPRGKTGWFKGADGKMRFEIDDNGANILYKDKEIYTNDPITTLLDHKELYKQYPELKDVKVTIYSPMSKDADSISANYNSEKNLIMVNRNKIKSPEGLKSSLLHEIQHAIQNKEGFAKGGSAGRELQDWAYNEQSYVRKITKLLQEDLSKIESNPRLKKAFSELDNEMIKENPNFSKIENEYKDVLKPYQNLSKDIARQKDMEKSLDSTDYELYKSLAGEVEARNVQARMGLTAKERTIKKPESTEDIPRAKQIIRMDSKGPSLLKIPEIGKKVEVGNKSKQLEFIKKNNPMTDDYHTGIREIKDIKTFKETLSDPESLVYPDFTKEMAENAIKEGKIRIYSSKNLDNPKAQFITPSKMQAKDYAGNKEIYSKIVDLGDVAWINSDEGQLVGKIKSIVKNPLVEEARKYKGIKKYGASSNDINIDARRGINTEIGNLISEELKTLPSYEGKTLRTSNSIFGKDISEINIGDILSDKGFLSSAKNKSKIWGDYGDYEIVIKSKTGKDITKIKGKIYDKYEPEILFDRNTKFIVKNIKGNKVYIEEL